jgi:hypothetical protein
MATVDITQHTGKASALGRAINRSMGTSATAAVAKPTARPRPMDAKTTKAVAQKREARLGALSGTGDWIGDVLDSVASGKNTALDGELKKSFQNAAKLLNSSKGKPTSAETVAELKTLQNQCVAWLSQAGTSDGSKLETSTNACVPQVRHLLNEIRSELMDAEMEMANQRREGIALASEDAALENALAGPSRKALEAYEFASTNGQKNGPEALKALGSLDTSLGLWLDDPSNAKHPQRDKVKGLLVNVQRESNAIQRTQNALGKLKIAPDPATFKATGKWSGDDVKGMNIGSASMTKGTCRDGTEEAQIRTFVKMLEDEAARSDVFAQLVCDLTEGADNKPLVFAFGKNSCGFGDSSGTMAVDIDDFKSMPNTPARMTTADGREVTAGVVGPEVLLHVIEERYVMQQNGGNYAPAHTHCLSRGSLQNRYRREIGAEGDSVIFDCVEHKHDHGTKHSEQMADFIAVDSNGIIQTTKNIKFHKDEDPSIDYKPDPSQSSMKSEDFSKEMDRRIEKVWQILENKCKAQHGDVGVDWKQQDWKILGENLELRYGDLVDAEKQVNDAKKSYEKKFKDLASTEKKLLVQNQKVWKVEIASKTKTAKAVFDEPPVDDASAELKRRREERTKAGNLNDSLDKKFDGRINYATQNCALTSLGAISGKKSGDVVRHYLEAKGIKGPQLEKFERQQDTTVFYRAQNNLLGTPEGEGKMPVGTTPEVGDAQLTGIRELISMEIEQRNKTSKIKYEAVQEGCNDHGQMFKLPEMFKRMKKYPNGTQFQVFLYAESGVEGVHGGKHWIYAEIYNGKLVVEDYQKAVGGGKKEAETAYLVDDGSPGPNHPTTEEPSVFTDGCFIAIAPKGAATTELKKNADTKNPKFAQFS